MIRRVWRYQRGNQNPLIDEEQTTQWLKETVQKDKLCTTSADILNFPSTQKSTKPSKYESCTISMKLIWFQLMVPEEKNFNIQENNFQYSISKTYFKCWP